MLRGGSRSFFAASLLLPRRVRQPATALYAFCRLADDMVDKTGRRDAIDELRERLHRVYAERPIEQPPDRAFTAVVSRYAIPRQIPEALLEGLEWDIEGRQYPELSSLRAYAARVAGTVGVMMTLIMGQRDPDTLARACDLGVAMQLTNIARDVGEDARAGRLYLPAQWLHDAGIDPREWLRRPVFSAGLADVIRRLLAEAETLYQRAEPGVLKLPRACQLGIRSARRIYAGIGAEIERRDCDAVAGRAVVPAGRKLALMTRALVDGMSAAETPEAASLEESRFLLEAVAAVPGPSTDAMEEVPGRVTERLVWMLELFEKLERRERLSRGLAQ